MKVKMKVMMEQNGQAGLKPELSQNSRTRYFRETFSKSAELQTETERHTSISNEIRLDYR